MNFQRFKVRILTQPSGELLFLIKKSRLQRDIRIRILNHRLYNLKMKIENEIKYLYNLRGNSEWNAQILSSRDLITPVELKKILNNCQWDSLVHWSKLFRYGGRDYTVRKAEPQFRSTIDILSEEMAKKYKSHGNFFYSCLNQRGLR